MPATGVRLSQLHHIRLTCLGVVLLAWLLGSAVSHAQAPTPAVDWRQGLHCNPAEQAFEGLLYCTGQDQNGDPTHVIIADLANPDLRLEYVFAKGYSDGHTGLQECRDVNIPRWGGPAGGCFAPSDRAHYPVMSMATAVEHAREIQPSLNPAAVINTDYMAPNRTHGPEGLAVIRGQRIDGITNNDTDYNGALRPWIAFGESRDPASGLLQSAVSRLARDDGPVPDWVYTGVGGGPWLVRDGQVYGGSRNCQGNKQLDTPHGTRRESYSSGSCRDTAHTAAGLSQDGRWLFLVITTAGRPDITAKYLRYQLGAWNALKFDGGSSSQLWYAGAPDPNVFPASRPLANFLAIYAPPGKGIRLPLDASATEPIFYQVIKSDETAVLRLTVRNTSPFTWLPEDEIELREEPWRFISPVVQSYPLPGPVKPGETVSWEIQRNTSSPFTATRFQMYHRGQAFGREFGGVIVVLPRRLEDQRDKIKKRIQEMIDDFKQRGEVELDKLLKELQKMIERELQNLLERLLREVEDAIERFLNELCGSSAAALFIMAVGLAFAGHRRFNR